MATPELIQRIDAHMTQFDGEFQAETVGLLYQALTCTDTAEWCPDPEWAIDDLHLPFAVTAEDILAWNDWTQQQADDADRYSEVNDRMSA